MSKKLYVGNLSYQATEGEIEAKFAEFGNVDSVKIITDFETGRSKGFAFVEMASADEAQQCIDSLDGNDFMGRGVRVSIAKERKENTRSGGAGAGANARRW